MNVFVPFSVLLSMRFMFSAFKQLIHHLTYQINIKNHESVMHYLEDSVRGRQALLSGVEDSS